MLFTTREHNGLRLFKYKNKVFYDNLWTKDLLDMRGTVYDALTDKLVQYPFTKIFNYKENLTVISAGEEVTASYKVNGFMAAVTIHKDKLLVTTTGGLDTDFTKLAEFNIRRHTNISVNNIDGNYTYLFEIVDETDPHIIQEKPGVYYLGRRLKELGSPIILDIVEFRDSHRGVKGYTPFKSTFAGVLERNRITRSEGFVVYGKTTTLKLKSPYYLALKFLMRNKKKVRNFWHVDYTKTEDEDLWRLINLVVNTHSQDEWMSLTELEKREFLEGVY